MKGVVEQLPEKVKQSMISKKIWTEECPVSLDDLMFVRVQHLDFSNEVKDGELVVHSSKAQNVLKIFEVLYKIKFPIQQVKLIDEYDGDDEASLAANNSSCFNFRKIAGSDKVSIHGYGLAIDINPIQNPAVVLDEANNSVSIHPKEGMYFLNRNNDRPGMVEPIVEIFKTYGFDVWGGNWNTPIDYQHFQAPKPTAKVAGITTNEYIS